MTNGDERLDRIEHILGQMARSQESLARSQESLGKNQESLGKNQENLAQNQEGLSKLQKETAVSLKEAAESLVQVNKALQEMAVRQQYHDEAFERFDADMKVIKEAIAIDAENIRALVRIAELHNRRFEDLEGGSNP